MTIPFACPVFGLKWSALREDTLYFLAVGGPIIGMDEQHPDFKLARDLMRENTQNPFHGAGVDGLIRRDVPLAQYLFGRLYRTHGAQFPLSLFAKLRCQFCFNEFGLGLGGIWVWLNHCESPTLNLVSLILCQKDYFLERSVSACLRADSSCPPSILAISAMRSAPRVGVRDVRVRSSAVSLDTKN